MLYIIHVLPKHIIYIAYMYNICKYLGRILNIIYDIYYT